MIRFHGALFTDQSEQNSWGSRMLPSLLVVDTIPDHVCQRLSERFRIVQLGSSGGHGPKSSELTDGTRYVLAGSDDANNHPINTEFINSLPDLELIASFGAGYDRIDTVAAASRGVVVTNTPHVHIDEVADFAIGLMIATVREIPKADRFVRDGKWSESSFPLSQGTLRGRRIGIAGLGAIGRAVAHRATSFGLSVSYYGRQPKADVPYKFYGSLKALSSAVDILMVTLPGGNDTRHAVDASVLAQLGPDGVLINVSRGSVVDEKALIHALREERILSAGLDVFSNEPHVPKELTEFTNVVLQPHIGSATALTRRGMWQLAIDNLLAWVEGRGPLTPVIETPWPRVAPERPAIDLLSAKG